ncbi:uncharacterized protein LOC100182129 [Ciona intestinalis]
MTSVAPTANDSLGGRSAGLSEILKTKNENDVTGRNDVITRDDVTKKVKINWKRRFRREFSFDKMGLDEKMPRKFSTSAWTESHTPYIIYRAICFIHAVVVLSWKASIESVKPETEQMPWILSFPAWTFILYTTYHTLALVLATFEFFHDCLCNDDLDWYHKLCWVLQNVSFNGSVSCFIGSIVYYLSVAASDLQFMNLTEFFKSDDVNLYVISGIVMIIDTFITNTSVRILHVIYPVLYYVIYFIFHIYRWGSGFTPKLRVLDYGTSPDSAVPFVIITVLVYCPFIHVIAYVTDTLRWKLLITCVRRHRKRLHDVMRAAETRATSNGSRFVSAGSYSRMQTTRETIEGKQWEIVN